jgi:hypothetical protein
MSILTTREHLVERSIAVSLWAVCCATTLAPLDFLTIRGCCRTSPGAVPVWLYGHIVKFDAGLAPIVWRRAGNAIGGCSVRF